MKRFPGRTLDELDAMDWGRYLRALAADSVQQIEAKLDMMGQGKIQSSDITPDEWEEIAIHEALIERYG